MRLRRVTGRQTHFTRDVSGEVTVGGEFETAGVLGGVVHNVNVPRLQTENSSVTRQEQRRLSGEGARWAYLVDPQFPHDDVVHRRRHFAPHVVISAGVELQVDVSCGAEKIGLNRLSSHRTALGKKVLPNGMTEIYFPRNLLSMVMCCQRVQPRCEITWWAAAGG